MEQQRIGSSEDIFTDTPGTSNIGPSTAGSTTTQSTAVTAAKEQGQRALDSLRQNAISKIEDQKSVACQQVESLANGLRRTGETLEREGSEPFGRLATTAADSVQRVGGYLQRTDVESMLRDFGMMARRHPTAVFGAAVAAGVLLGRFLRSSTPSQRDVVFEPDASLLDSSSGFGNSGLGSTSMSSGLGSTGPDGLGNGSTTPSTPFGEPPTGGWA